MARGAALKGITVVSILSLVSGAAAVLVMFFTTYFSFAEVLNPLFRDNRSFEMKSNEMLTNHFLDEKGRTFKVNHHRSQSTVKAFDAFDLDVMAGDLSVTETGEIRPYGKYAVTFSLHELNKIDGMSYEFRKEGNVSWCVDFSRSSLNVKRDGEPVFEISSDSMWNALLENGSCCLIGKPDERVLDFAKHDISMEFYVFSKTESSFGEARFDYDSFSIAANASEFNRGIVLSDDNVFEPALQINVFAPDSQMINVSGSTFAVESPVTLGACFDPNVFSHPYYWLSLTVENKTVGKSISFDNLFANNYFGVSSYSNKTLSIDDLVYEGHNQIEVRVSGKASKMLFMMEPFEKHYSFNLQKGVNI